MTIPSTLESLSTTAASNGPSGSDQRTLADDGLRQAYAFLAQVTQQGADISSSSTITPTSVGWQFDVTGTTGISTIASTNSWNGRLICVQFDGALTLTHSSNLYLPGAANITTVAGDVALFLQRGSGSWQCINYQRKDGTQGGAAYLPLAGGTLSGALVVSPPSGTPFTVASNNADMMVMNTPGVTTSSNILIEQGAQINGYIGADGTQRLVSGSTDGDLVIRAAAGPSSAGVLRLVTSASGASTQLSIGSGGNVTISAPASGDTLTVNGATSGSFRINATGLPYGTALHNNAGAVTGTTNQYIASGTYTPTLTNVANVSTLTAGVCQWIRVGNVVTVSGTHSIASTVGGTVCQFRQSLPIASNIAAKSNVGGSFGTHNGFEFGPIIGDATNDAAYFEWQTTNTSAFDMGFQFMYVIA